MSVPIASRVYRSVPVPTKMSSTSLFLIRSNSYAGHAVIRKPTGTATSHAASRQYQWTGRRGPNATGDCFDGDDPV